MHLPFLTFYGWYGRFLTWIAIVAGAMLFLLMWLVNFNALARKLFNAPIAGTLEITEALMPIIILLPMAFTQFRRGHVRVMMISERLSPGARRTLHVVALVVGCVFCAWVAWATWGYAVRSYRIEESAWGAIRFPIWPSKASIVLGATLLSFQFLLDVVKVSLYSDDDPDGFGSVAPEIEAARHG